ncbi:hypothetical protein GCM10009727_37980 [Actinomadura napierensis]|uniref:Uncharacterized protein n=1 Tax=Actinomadura napierensis TaxID=267854 RepID=A0ABP5L4S1_9ACTN
MFRANMPRDAIGTDPHELLDDATDLGLPLPGLGVTGGALTPESLDERHLLVPLAG